MRISVKRVAGGAAVVALLIFGAPLERAMLVPTHLVSHQLCSAVFDAGLEPEWYYADAVRPAVWPVGALISYRVDRARQEVTARFAGLLASRAVYRGPLGCQVDHGTPLPAIPARQQATSPLQPPIAGPDPVETQNSGLKAALDHDFEEPAEGGQRKTQAIVILQDGRIVAERYAPGVGVDTPLIGWSLTKSVTNALLGILVREHQLNVTAPAPVAAWADPADPRHAITPDQLLRMASGLDIGQSLYADWTSAFDPASQMNYDMADEAGFAEQAKLAVPPGSVWKYTNGNTLLLSRLIRDRVGGDAASVYRFVHEQLFDKLGMCHATLEFDGAGTPIGSHLLWASARDWARFGQLYLDDGVAGGERILPEGWVGYSARFTPHSEDFGYGAGFWTNRGDSFGAAYRTERGVPRDAFFAKGTIGQYVIIIPSERMVVVRLGRSPNWPAEADGVFDLVHDVVAATSGKAKLAGSN